MAESLSLVANYVCEKYYGLGGLMRTANSNITCT